MIPLLSKIIAMHILLALNLVKKPQLFFKLSTLLIQRFKL